jgi:hypothetical protein
VYSDDRGRAAVHLRGAFPRLRPLLRLAAGEAHH